MEGGKGFGNGGCYDMLSLLGNSNNSHWQRPSSSFHEGIMSFGQEPKQGLRGANPISDRCDMLLAQQGLRGTNPISNRCDMLLAQPTDVEDIDRDPSEVNLYNNAEKKRRLTAEQAQFLERSFELENKLEPERKMQLAKEVGMQPRQVAVWFQNRRARYKTKQIEKELDSLKDRYVTLKDEYDILFKEKEFYKNEVEYLKKILAQMQGRDIDSNPGDIQQMFEGTTNFVTHGRVDKTGSAGVVLNSMKQVEDGISAKSDIFDHESPHCIDGNQSSALLGRVDKTGSAGVVLHSMKQVEDASSAKSDIVDYESPHCVDGNQSSALLETDSTPLMLMRDPDHQSDFSQEEDFMIPRSLLLPQTPPTFNNFLNVADDDNYDPNANSCNFSLVDDQPNLYWFQ